MRSLLTMLGIIIGIASIIAIASTIQGTNEQLKQNLLGAGNNTVNVKLCRSDSEYEFDDYTGIPAGVPVFTAVSYTHLTEAMSRLVISALAVASSPLTRSWVTL